MLVLAGLIEGFFTPLPIAPPLKLSFAFFSLALIALYFQYVGKGKSAKG
jgi:hypothetical protein